MVIQNDNFNKFINICKNTNNLFTAPKMCVELFDYINLPNIKIETITPFAFHLNNIYTLIMLASLSNNLEITFSDKYTYKKLYPTLSNYIANTIILHNSIKNMHANLCQLNELIKGENYEYTN